MMKRILLTPMFLSVALAMCSSCAVYSPQPDQGFGQPNQAGEWFASCSTGHGEWHGPMRNTRQEAETDADAHDQANHGGAKTAVVERGSQTQSTIQGK